MTSSIYEPLAIVTSRWSIILTLYLWTFSSSQWRCQPGHFSMAAHRHDRRGIYRCVLLRFRGRIEIDHSYGPRCRGLCCHSRHNKLYNSVIQCNWSPIYDYLTLLDIKMLILVYQQTWFPTLNCMFTLPFLRETLEEIQFSEACNILMKRKSLDSVRDAITFVFNLPSKTDEK